MNLLPVIERELRLRARGRGTYWTRFVAALVGLVVCLPLLTLREGGDPEAAAGRFGFSCMVVGAFLLSCTACLLTADVNGWFTISLECGRPFGQPALWRSGIARLPGWCIG